MGNHGQQKEEKEKYKEEKQKLELGYDGLRDERRKEDKEIKRHSDPVGVASTW